MHWFFMSNLKNYLSSCVALNCKQKYITYLLVISRNFLIKQLCHEYGEETLAALRRLSLEQDGQCLAWITTGLSLGVSACCPQHHSITDISHNCLVFWGTPFSFSLGWQFPHMQRLLEGHQLAGFIYKPSKG
jgi:hypothetical protein